MSDTRDSCYFLRSKLHDYRAAGVLPLAVADGEVVCLLGVELCRTGPRGKVRRHMWRDFGGVREAVDADPAATAGREFAEETLGLFGGCSVDPGAIATSAAAMAAQLRARDRSVCVVRQLHKGSYHMFVAATTFIDPILYHAAMQQHAALTRQLEGAAEKLEWAWLPLAGLLRAVAHTRRQYHYSAHERICSRQPGALGRRHMLQIHPSFAESLRVAQACGLSELAQAVAGGAQRMPPPPPPPLPGASAVPVVSNGLAPTGARAPCATLYFVHWEDHQQETAETMDGDADG